MTDPVSPELLEATLGEVAVDANLGAGLAGIPADSAPDDPPGPAVADEVIVRQPAGRTPGVRGDDPWAEAGRKVLRFHLARMLGRAPGVIAGEDPEEVHAMRVAARRMRAAWRVFGDGFEHEAKHRYVADLRDVGARLGAVRDLDVLIEVLIAHAATRSDRHRAGLAPLLGSWDAEREGRRAQLVELLQSERYAAFAGECQAFVETPGLAALPRAPNAAWHVRDRMPATAWGAYQAVWAFDSDLADANLGTLHQLHIAGKWLRYTLEFAREAIEPEGPVLIARAVALQDHLGGQHDLHVAATLARDFAASAPLMARERRATDRFVRDLDEGVEQLSRTFGRIWRPIVAPDYRRRLGRALAHL